MLKMIMLRPFLYIDKEMKKHDNLVVLKKTTKTEWDEVEFKKQYRKCGCLRVKME